MRALCRRLWYLLRRSRRDAELREEMETHRLLRQAHLEREGMVSAAAETGSHRALGNATLARDDARDVWGVAVVSGLWQDTRQAVRALVRRPLLTATAIATLALAIGANIAIFGVIDRVLLRPLDVPDVEELVTFEVVFESRGNTTRRTWMHWHAATEISKMTTLREAAIASSPSVPAAQRTTNVRVSVPDPDAIDLDNVRAAFVSANYFRVLGLQPAAGRDFGAGDDDLTAPPVTILSHAFWRTRLGAAPDAVGRRLLVNGTPTLVVGIASPSFTGTSLSLPSPELILPLMTASRLATDTGTHTNGRNNFVTGDRPGFVRSPVSPVSEFVVLARIEPSRVHEAHAQLTALADADHLVRHLSGTTAWHVKPLVDTLLPFEGRDDLRRFLILLGSAVALTLLIGCANLATVLLARSEERRAELAIRAALGAGRRRLVQVVALEAVALSVAGGAAAFVVAGWITRGLSAFVLPGGIAIESLRDGADARTMAFLIAAVTATAALVGFASAIRAARRDLALEARRGSRGAAGMGASKVLVAAQVAVCTVLVFLAALFVRSTSNALGMDLGFDRQNLLTAAMAFPPGMRPTAADFSADIAHRVAEAARRVPGVVSATIGPLPLSRGSDTRSNDLQVDGKIVELSTPVDSVYARTEFFSTLGLPVLRGRLFTDDDRTGTPLVALVNEAAARRFWPDGDAVGRRVGFPPPPGNRARGQTAPDFEVVGVVRDVKLRALDEASQPVIYVPRAQHHIFMLGMAHGGAGLHLIVRTQGDGVGLADGLARVAGETGLTLQSITTLDESIEGLLMPQRLGRGLLALLGAMALTLTVVGIYGVVSCIVSRRSKEIGIRLALGASGRDIVVASVGGVVLPVAAGAAVGGAVALGGGHLVDRFMYGMAGADPTTLAMAVGVIAATGTVAALVPTRRATRINPIETLRTD
jgi:predicted permease